MVASAVNLRSPGSRLAAQENFGPGSEERHSTNLYSVKSSQGDSGQTEDSSVERLLERVLHPARGISLEPMYYGEVFTNTRGGLSTNDATKYNALLDLALTVDFDALQVPLPGRFFLLAQNTHGRGLTADFVGDTQFISNIDSSGDIMQVSEYWWEFGMLDDAVTIRLGKQDLNTEFLVMGLAQDFIQSSFGLSPSAGFPSYPAPAMSAVVLAQLTPSLELKVGIWDALADGRGWGFSGNDVILTFGELEYEYALADGRLPGALDLGVAYASAGGVGGQALPSAYGSYIQLEQLIFRENGASDDSNPQGLGIFGSYFPRFINGTFPISVIENNFVLGMVYSGPFSGCDEDTIGAGIAWARVDQGGTNQETAIVVFYKARVNSSLSIQPDIQYIASPSGIHSDALAVGLRVELAL